MPAPTTRVEFVALAWAGDADSPFHSDQVSGGLAVEAASEIDQENLATGGIALGVVVDRDPRVDEILGRS